MNDAILRNVNQIVVHLRDDYRVTQYRVAKAIERHELIPRRGGGWTPASVEQWARRCLTRKVTSGDGDDAPALTSERQCDLLTPQSVSEAKAAEQTALLAVQRKKSEMEYARMRGRLMETATVHEELAARAQAFRRGLERFGLEQAEEVAGDFGATARAAADLAQRLGFEGEAAERAAVTIQNFVLSRAQLFSVRWSARIEDFLDPYATGAWWTPAMREAWERYEHGRETEEAASGSTDAE